MHDFLQIKAAAKFLGVSPNTLRNWERSGKLTTYRHPINGYRLYKKTDLETLLSAIQRSDQVTSHSPELLVSN
ncbi:MAG: helix-turn-helix domain-containing protein [Chloroflexota bacterium]